MAIIDTLERSVQRQVEPAASAMTLRGSVEQAMRNYFSQLNGRPVVDLYAMVLAEVEAPLLEVVMRYTRHNQSKAAILLGLSRGTLRKKLKQYGLLGPEEL